MSDYVKSTNFYIKDTLLTGNPDKIVKGSEIDTEFNNIATAVASKANYASPALTGIPTAPTAAPGNNSSQIATTAFIKAAVDANNANVAITNGTISGVTITDLDEPIDVADGGTGVTSIPAKAVLIGNGSDPITAVAPGTSGNLLTSDGTQWLSSAPPSGGFGYGQTWHDVTSSRALNSVYTNSTSKPIMVNVFVSDAGASSSTLYINDMAVASNYGNSIGGYSGSTLSAIVPIGATYKVTQGAGNSGWGPWVEFKE